MTVNRVVMCEWCGVEFEATGSRGPLPKYCRRSHRQRHYEAKHFAKPTALLAPTPPSDDHVGDAVTALRTVLDVGVVGEVNQARPTELRAAIAELAGPLSDVLAAIGIDDPADVDAVERFVVAGLVAGQLTDVRGRLELHQRSAVKLRQALADIDSAARALVDPTAKSSALAPFRRVLPVSIPGPDGRRPAGQVSCRDEGGGRVVRWLADDGTDWRGVRLERVVAASGKPYRLSDTKEWDRLAGDVVTVVCGWISSPFPLPELLGVSATAELARSLRGQFMRGSPEWSLDSWTIARWLEDSGFIHIGSDTGITDHALLTSTENMSQ